MQINWGSMLICMIHTKLLALTTPPGDYVNYSDDDNGGNAKNNNAA